MQTSSLPKRIPTPFADSGSKQDIPVASQIGITGGRASYTDGFPPLTRTPLSAGGIPPFGTDFNGVLNDVTAAIRWDNAGAGYPFDATFATSIAGYPKGAVIPNSLGDGYWLNITDANTSNPEVSTGSLTGWVPYETYGVTSITGLASSSVTLTSLQAAKDRIKLSGTLTSNINIVVPAWNKKWTVVNNCTGSFTVTVKTPSGAGVAIPSGLTANLIGDGTNIIQDSALLGYSGRIIGVQVISATGLYTKTPGTKNALVEVVGAGGGGGGVSATASGSLAIGGGGGGGGYALGYFDVSSVTTVSCTIGLGGAGGVGTAVASGGGLTGTKGGTTSFGTLLQATGGDGGPGNGTTTSASGTVTQKVGALGGTGTLGVINSDGSAGGQGLMTNSGNSIAGYGGASFFSGAVRSAFGSSSAGNNGKLGSGGSGALSDSSPSSPYNGGNGGNGLIKITELA